MENVVAFNNELSGLYDCKPPISKAKMAAITKSAMRAIKFYKHVVQSVEKFILKCKPEYKVPGLYVIDSIVRQSRHQFGAEKDVFAPRFARNIKDTFANLFRCAPEDKSRIIRVLNLWQKNNVFAPDVIQPIFDLADPNHPIYQMPPPGVANIAGSLGLGDISASSNGLNSSMDMNMSVGGAGAGAGGIHGSTVTEDKLVGIPDLSSLSHEKAQNVLDNSTLRQLEHMQQYLKRQTATAQTNAIGASSSSTKSSREVHVMHVAGGGGGGVGSAGNYSSSVEGVGGNSGLSTATKSTDSYSKYHKSSHEFVYDEDDVGDNSSSAHASNLLDNNNLQQLLNDPNILRQLQTLQNFQKIKQQEDKQHKLNEMRLQEEAFEKHLQNVLKGSSAAVGLDNSEAIKEVEFVSEEKKIEVINLDGNDSRSPSPDRDRYKRRRSRSHSRERGVNSARGTSRDRDRDRRRRSRSRSRSPRSSRRRLSRERVISDRTNERINRERDKEKEREHERERRRKGLPDTKKEHLSVCSTTLWVGHLSKLVYQEELSDTFGEYGDIVSIDQIVPRGCAFIVMNRRQDANKAMQALKNHKLQGRAITISWAAGKGVKSKEWKDFWDLELGVTYIPWNKLDQNTDFDSLEEGGMFDEDSMPNWMKDKIHHMKNIKEQRSDANVAPPPGLLFGIDTTQPPPGPPGAPGPPAAPLTPLMGMVGTGQFPIPPSAIQGPPPRPLLGAVGVPLPSMPMPPNMAPGLPPPPHPMMLPNIMPPGFPPMPPGQIDKGRGGGIADGVPPLGPPPMAPFLSMSHPNMGLPPTGPAHFQLPGQAVSVSNNDDQMDIEMEEDGASHDPMHFNQPPPFQGVLLDGDERGNSDFNRERRGGGPGNTRWGRRDGGGDEDEGPDGPGGPSLRWHENGGGGGKFGGNGRPQHFGDGRGGREGHMMNMPPMDMPPMDMPPMDMNMNMPQRPDFMNDFDMNGLPRGGPNGDFFPPNMQNRFNQPTSLFQMRIPPPNAFNPRMNGPPMFMRGQGGVGPGGGGRQQGPGFFNDRPPFDRGPGNGRGGRGGRGGGGPNWRDDVDDDGNGMFKRRMPGGPGGGGGNRFRDRDCGMEEWYGRDRGGGGGPGRRGGGRGGGDRNMRGRRDNNDRGGRFGGPNRGPSRDEGPPRDGDWSFNNLAGPAAFGMETRQQQPPIQDTEEDWDRELEDFDANSNIGKKIHNPFASTPPAKPFNESHFNTDASTKETMMDGDEKNYESSFGQVAQSTPLYDELPAPALAMTNAGPQENEIQGVTGSMETPHLVQESAAKAEGTTSTDNGDDTAQ